MSPFESESRIAAQLAPFTTVELMPYFLNSPRSCAMTIGEQSVSAIMPKRRSATSGALVDAAFALAAGLAAAMLASVLLQAGRRLRRRRPLAYREIDDGRDGLSWVLRLERVEIRATRGSEHERNVELHDLLLQVGERLVERHRERDARAEPHLFPQLGVETRADRPGRRVAQCFVGLDRVGVDSQR
jgi:hypothetical protein